MITEEQILEYIGQQVQHPVSESNLAQGLGADTVEALVELKILLQKLEQESRLIFSKKKRYGLPEHFEMRTGFLIRHPKGFGFVRVEGSDEEDIYIHAKDLNGAMNGDRVLVRLKRAGGFDPRTMVKLRAEGKIHSILERKVQRVVGTFESSRHFGFVVPDDQRFGSDIFISKDDFGGARTGMKVLVEITGWPEAGKKAEGKIIQLIGQKDAPGVDILSIILGRELPQGFSAEVLEAAEAIPQTISRQEIQRRQDLRNLRMITIDGEDARDLDDAVSLELLENGNYLLGVHIADVGHYVTEGSVLDQEAIARATSIYLVDRVIPMLPQRLSNGICSLNAGEDRLAMTCRMEIDHSGQVVAHDIFESVICVNHRMTYKAVTAMLEGDAALCSQYEDILPMVKQMEQLQGILQRKRHHRGAIEFHAPESKVILDKKGRPVDIVWRTRGIADRMIEEFMLAANETVAEHYFWMEVPFLYRVHEEPKGEDVQEVNQFLQALGYSIKGAGNSIHPKAYQTVLQQVEGAPEEQLIHTVLLRSMQHARYDTESLGHFGLSAKYYSHFTSPIRRYPDLAIHRVIKELLHNGEQLNRKRAEQLQGLMSYYAQQSSLREKIAEEAERESVELKKVQYMKPYEGEVFPAVVSGVTGFGIFVQLENSVEGLVHISTLTDDFYQYRPERFSLLGERSGRSYRLGQQLIVRLTRVSVENRQIDFEVVKQP